MNLITTFNDSECVICFSSKYKYNHFSTEKSLYITSCGHKFHKKCLTKWCKENNSCPTCRNPDVMLIYDEPNFIRRNSSSRIYPNSQYITDPALSPRDATQSPRVLEENLQEILNNPPDINHSPSNTSNHYYNNQIYHYSNSYVVSQESIPNQSPIRTRPLSQTLSPPPLPPRIRRRRFTITDINTELLDEIGSNVRRPIYSDNPSNTLREISTSIRNNYNIYSNQTNFYDSSLNDNMENIYQNGTLFN